MKNKKTLVAFLVCVMVLCAMSVTIFAENVTNFPKSNAAKIGDTEYATVAEALESANAGDELVLLADVEGGIDVPADVTFNGNGFAVSGTLYALGDITFTGHTKANAFDFENVGTEINIGIGACFELTGTGRMIIGHGCTFNIEGNIENAKTANAADITPSLIMPGASFTGAGVTFNVKNAYIKTTASYCSSSKSASGIFDFNIENSIWEQFGKLAFESQSTAATVNFDLKDSVLTTTSHLVFGVSKGEIVIDNSNVNVGVYRQLENQSTMTIKNGSVVYASVNTSSNCKNPGTTIVDNATYNTTGDFSGSDLGTGTLVVKNGAKFTTGKITKANIIIDAEGLAAGEVDMISADLSKLVGTVSVVNGNFEAKIENNKIVLAVKPVAQIGDTKYASLADAIADAKNGDTVKLLEDIEVDTETYIIADDVSITLDMNGKKIAITDKATGNYELFYIYGGLTATGEGTIELTSTIDRGWSAMSAVFHNRGGVLTIENGTFKNLGGTDMAWVVDNSGNSYGDAKTTVNGGTLASSYIAIRNRMDTYGANGGGNGVAHLVVNGGELSGKYAVWGQVSSRGCKGLIEITDGTFIGTSAAILVGEDNTGDVKTAISGGIYSNDVTEYLAEGFEIVKNEDGTFGVAEEKPVLPEATVTKLGAITVDEYAVYNGSGLSDGTVPIDLQIAMQFTAQDDEITAKENYYADYVTDFFIQIDGMSGESFDGTGCYLAGYYDFFGGWVKVPLDGMTIENGKVYPVISSVGFEFTYVDICNFVKDFKCGIYLTDKVLEENPNLNLTLSLGLSETMNDAQAGNFINVDNITYVKNDFIAEYEEKLDTVTSYIRNIATTNDKGESRYQVILFAGIDSLDYSKVGFEITVDGDTREQATNIVYTSYTAAGVTFYPHQWGENCKYIFALPINFKTDFKDKTVTFRPFALKKDGTTKVYADEGNIDKIYNK